MKTSGPQLALGSLHRLGPQKVPGLPQPLELTIYLPAAGGVYKQRWPVAYMFDGQNLFQDAGSFAGGWHLHTALDRRAGRHKLVPIVVGVHHGGPSRAIELSPWPMEDQDLGLGDRLLDWIMGPLAAMVSKDLPALDGPRHTLIGGSSLGGMMALYGFFRNPEFFGRALCMSPALWVNDGEIFYHVAHARVGGEPRLYLDCGGREARGAAIAHGRWMADLLRRKGFVEGRHYMWRPDARGSHNERSWRRRLPKALRFLYG